MASANAVRADNGAPRTLPFGTSALPADVFGVDPSSVHANCFTYAQKVEQKLNEMKRSGKK